VQKIFLTSAFKRSTKALVLGKRLPGVPWIRREKWSKRIWNGKFRGLGYRFQTAVLAGFAATEQPSEIKSQKRSKAHRVAFTPD
jgi:hypothetical protein